MSREQVLARLEAIRDSNTMAALAFDAYRDLNRTDAEPFLKAALERNPVAIAATQARRDDELVALVEGLADESIYDDGGRLAQPDEVWNYGRGDGAEKAILLANLFRARHPDAAISIAVEPGAATVSLPARSVRFASRKGLHPQQWDCTRFAPSWAGAPPPDTSEDPAPVSAGGMGTGE